MARVVLVTGATGFIGRALVASLRAKGRSFIALGSADGDIRNASTLQRHAGEDIEVVIHLAGRSFVPDSWTVPAEFIEVNVGGTAQVLEFCRAQDARMVFVSGYVYGMPDGLPIAETAPVRPNNPYALSKALAEELCHFYAAHYGVPATVVRPFNVYGPGQPDAFLIPKILRQVVAGSSIQVMDLDPRRDWVFVDDVADALVSALEDRGGGYNVFNLGSGTSHSVAEVIAIAQEAAGTRLAVQSRRAARPNELPDVVAGIAKARRDLNWRPRIELTEGIKRTLASMDAHS